MNIAKLLLEIRNEYNGHKQTNIKGLSLDEGFVICKELENHCENEYSFVMEIWTDLSFTINQKDYFSVDNLTGRDRIILSSDAL